MGLGLPQCTSIAPASSTCTIPKGATEGLTIVGTFSNQQTGTVFPPQADAGLPSVPIVCTAVTTSDGGPATVLSVYPDGGMTGVAPGAATVTCSCLGDAGSCDAPPMTLDCTVTSAVCDLVTVTPGRRLRCPSARPSR